MTEDLKCLANILAERNHLDVKVSTIIGRPATQGHIGEFIASRIFGIELSQSATNKGFDGKFILGALAGRTVDVKLYGKQEGVLAVNEKTTPDFFLVMTGPKSRAISSKGQTRPCVIEQVYLFDGPSLVIELKCRNVKLSVSTSIASALWNAAEIYPRQANAMINLSKEQCTLLALFGSGAGA